ncbi:MULTISPECIES: TolC family outer membrane protein [unclassified Sphingopyxis]|jgi:adhesin transport system outer membrane protein|uniref:TolC family outer membrane protein n=1 Tax=unclassified Sphingopyxis TaxID=2614943 RepID=UPI000730978F|nr:MULTISPECIES: TolC family outer membrane protein [unclassified Sphingopyxis]MBD3731759.1 TolC family outer membrane protein [Sphingopyxis sp.]KTE24679.1 agglutination protein [Sphingopyxis sp. H057]KTE49639.1 agglutination protein [Sphingopyxis sp. H071]KTE50702.1 agglutination protein [Sphingopyxis sp. H073]KTE57127.1 agglutination protein [Sphingopyxis sp. H107]
MPKIRTAALLLTAVAVVAISGTARAQRVELKTAVETAMQTNPEINQAVENRTAIEFEREQAQGLFLPRVSVEGSAGIRRLENSTRRNLGIADDKLYPVEGSLRIEQMLFDGGVRSKEVKRQASRTDGAAFRVEERSQFIALQVTRQYLDYLLQQRIVAASQDNIDFHSKLVADLREGVAKGSLSIADQQQAEERQQAAQARLTESNLDLVNTGASFRTLTGLELVDGASLPPSLAGNIPASLEEALGRARERNPRVREAQADLDAAHAMVGKAKAEQMPTLALEGNARIGDDIDGFRGETNDLQAGVVMRWDVFNGGIKKSKVQEMYRREREARFRVDQMVREAEEDVRIAWNTWDAQGRLVKELEEQSRVSDELLRSYRAQFNVGRRSLLDVLDAQNTRYNVQVRAETAKFAQFYAEFKLLAALNDLLAAMEVAPPKAAIADARERFKVKPAPQTDPASMREPR